MLSKAKALKGYRLDSLDGEIGKVNEFYFDDDRWGVRYLLADTGNWLRGRTVLISPHALNEIHAEQRKISIDLTQKQIEDSPSLDSDLPVSRQFEESYYGYYGWPMYWSGPYLWGYYPYVIRNRELSRDFDPSEKIWDAHLRSTDEVTGYHVEATDGSIGHIDDFVIDDENWAIRYLIIETKNWLPGKKVLISPDWIESVSWDESKLYVNVSKETIKNAPEFTDELSLTRDYENALYRHYNRQGYWDNEPQFIEGESVRK